jgi:hypothetical protein
VIYLMVFFGFPIFLQYFLNDAKFCQIFVDDMIVNVLYTPPSKIEFEGVHWRGS